MATLLVEDDVSNFIFLFFYGRGREVTMHCIFTLSVYYSYVVFKCDEKAATCTDTFS